MELDKLRSLTRNVEIFQNYLKSKSNSDREAYKRNRNSSVNLLKHKKRDYIETLDLRSENDNKMLSKTMAPFFYSKSKVSNNIVLTEGNKPVDNDFKSTFK